MAHLIYIFLLQQITVILKTTQIYSLSILTARTLTQVSLS